MSINLSDNIIQPIPFYDSLEKKNSYKDYCGFNCLDLPLVSSDSLFPFITPYINFTEINLRCSNDDSLKEVLTGLIAVENISDILVYLGGSTGLDLDCGIYYLEIKNNSEALYSEDFKISDIEIISQVEKILDTEISGSTGFVSRNIANYSNILLWQEIILLNEGIVSEVQFKFYLKNTEQITPIIELRKDTFDGELIETQYKIINGNGTDWYKINFTNSEILTIGTHIFIIMSFYHTGSLLYPTMLISYKENSTYIGSAYLSMSGYVIDLEADPIYGRNTMSFKLYVNIFNNPFYLHDISPDWFHLPLRFYNKLINKSNNKNCSNICQFKNIFPADEIPAFMFSSTETSTGTITAKLICFDDSYSYSKDFTVLTIENETNTTYYHLWERLIEKLECGFFYIEITDGSNKYYSEDIYLQDFNPEPTEQLILLNEDGTPLLNEDGTPLLNEFSL
jgi:hypothetical protein